MKERRTPPLGLARWPRRDVKLERVYLHPPELVWHALTDREVLAEWLMPNDFSPEVGHRFTMRTDPGPGFDGVVHLEVLAIDPPRSMRWSWRGGPIDTELTFRLEPAFSFGKEGTRLILEHTGFEGVPAVLVSFILGAGWANMLEKRLEAVFEALARGERPDLRARARDMKKERWYRLARLFRPVLGKTPKRGA